MTTSTVVSSEATSFALYSSHAVAPSSTEGWLGRFVHPARTLREWRIPSGDARRLPQAERCLGTLPPTQKHPTYCESNPCFALAIRRIPQASRRSGRVARSFRFTRNAEEPELRLQLSRSCGRLEEVLVNCIFNMAQKRHLNSDARHSYRCWKTLTTQPKEN